MMFFRDYFGATLSVRIFKTWGNNAVEMAKENPYRLCEEIEGIGFEKADEMAEKIGFDRGGLPRVESGILYLLSYNAAQSGHTCLPEEKLRGSANDAQIAEVVDAEGKKLLAKIGASDYVIALCIEGMQAHMDELGLGPKA